MDNDPFSYVTDEYVAAEFFEICDAQMVELEERMETFYFVWRKVFGE